MYLFGCDENTDWPFDLILIQNDYLGALLGIGNHFSNANWTTIGMEVKASDYIITVLIFSGRHYMGMTINLQRKDLLL